MVCTEFIAEMDEFSQNTVLLQNEHEEQLKALRGEHEDELRRVQEELDVQKSKVCPNCFIN